MGDFISLFREGETPALVVSGWMESRGSRPLGNRDGGGWRLPFWDFAFIRID